MNIRSYIVWPALLGVFIGCHAENERAPKVAAAVATAPSESAGSAKQKSSTAPTLANPKVTSAHANDFKPPFPERTELFDPPKRALSTVRRDDEHGQSVELKGFITVDRPRVVLSIDGVISPIPEGGEKYGVHVISIQPPKVVLQRGRNRWVATLE
jgi:hypothetical protein